MAMALQRIQELAAGLFAVSFQSLSTCFKPVIYRFSVVGTVHLSQAQMLEDNGCNYTAPAVIEKWRAVKQELR